MTEIDLSKYAAGKKLRCICRESAPWLIYGKEYESLGEGHEGQVLVRTEYGAKYGYYFSRFVPVEDEAPEFKAGDRVRCTKAIKSWEEGGVRLGDDYTISGFEPSDKYLLLSGMNQQHSYCPAYFELVTPAALSPGHATREPVRLNEAQREAVGKVDKYNPHHMSKEHMLRNEQNIAAMMTGQNSIGNRNEAARLRNIAALRRELDDGSRMKAFPHPGRNFALEKWR